MYENLCVSAFCGGGECREKEKQEQEKFNTPKEDASVPSSGLSSWSISRREGPGSPNWRLLQGKYVYLQDNYSKITRKASKPVQITKEDKECSVLHSMKVLLPFYDY